jgi:hypothetical protein
LPPLLAGRRELVPVPVLVPVLVLVLVPVLELEPELEPEPAPVLALRVRRQGEVAGSSAEACRLAESARLARGEQRTLVLPLLHALLRPLRDGPPGRFR